MSKVHRGAHTIVTEVSGIQLHRAPLCLCSSQMEERSRTSSVQAQLGLEPSWCSAVEVNGSHRAESISTYEA